MSNRDLTTTREQVFGDVEPGTECRICGRAVDDGRSKTCSEYCNNILTAVMGMLNWSPVRRKVIERDDETCQECGFDYSRERAAQDHILALIDEKAGDPPDSPSILDLGAGEVDDFDLDDHRERWMEYRERREELEARYGDPYEDATELEVDHVVPIAEGGHPFDPANLQTLCEDCHGAKTTRENRERGRTPSRGDLSESLFEFVADGGQEDSDEQPDGCRDETDDTLHVCMPCFTMHPNESGLIRAYGGNTTRVWCPWCGDEMEDAEEMLVEAEIEGVIGADAGRTDSSGGESDAGDGTCPVCDSEPGVATYSTAPNQAVCVTDGCPINTWDPEVSYQP